MKLLIRLLIAAGSLSAAAFTVTMTSTANATGAATTRAFISAPVPAGTLADLVIAVAQAKAGQIISPRGTYIDLSVSPNRGAAPSGVAPLGVVFDASGTTAPALTSLPFHELYYVTHFGDDNSATWSYGTQPGEAKKNIGIGPIFSHVWETAGTFTVKTTAFHVASDSTVSMSGTVSHTVTVTDPDTVYAGTNTICISTDADFTGAPAGAATYTTSNFNTVCTYLASNKRVLLKRGGTWDSDGTQNSVVIDNATMAAFGTGAKPKVLHTGGPGPAFWGALGLLTSTDFRMLDIEYDGQQTSVDTSSVKFVAGGSGSTYVRCNWHHFLGGVPINNDCITVDSNYDNLMGGAGGVGIYVSQQVRFAILGNSVDNAKYIEHNIRIQGGKSFVIAHNYINEPMANGSKNGLTIRGWSKPFDGVNYAEKFVASDNKITGYSTALVNFQQQASAHDERLRDGIFERNLVKSTIGTGRQLLSAVISDMTIRNNVFDMTESAGYCIEIVGHEQANITTTRIYNNSVYCDTTTQFSFVYIHGSTTTYTASDMYVANNVAYAPTATLTGANNGTQGTFVFIGANVGTYTLTNNSTDSQIKNTTPGFTLPPTTMAHWTPTTYPVDAGAYMAGVVDDLVGTIRTGTMDMGAVSA